MARGVIHLLVPRKSLGFIDGPTGEVSFDWSAIEGMERGELSAGMEVEYEVVPSPAGPRAVRVHPAEDAEPTLRIPTPAERLRSLHLTKLRKAQ